MLQLPAVGHMAHECQNPRVSYSGWQKFTPKPMQGLNVHVQMFVPVQYQATVPMALQPMMLEPMPSFIQASGPPRVPMLANVGLARSGMVQGSVAAFTADQQMLN